jgi:CelD/BcsL family acetyltransferase involved in cellulose biosynthesis
VDGLDLVQLHSVGEIRAASTSWDDLWARSDCALPTARAELVAQWIEQFAPSARLLVLAVRQNERWLAALPLVTQRLTSVVAVGDVPGNAWTPCADLLVDSSSDAKAVLDRLIAGLRCVPWPLLWLGNVPLECSYWQAFLTALAQSQLAIATKRRLRVGEVEIGSDWEQYVRGRSRNHRRAMRRAADRAAKLGGVELEVHAANVSSQVEGLLRRGFAVEDRGWKGADGTSVLQSAGMFDFFCRQARQLAEWGQLQLVFLTHQGQDIAFEYGYRAKGVRFTNKVGYDEQFSQLAPGQLLRWRLYEQFHANEDVALVDFVGHLTEATAKWSTRTYALSRLVVAPPRLLSRLLLSGYRFMDRRFGAPELAREGTADNADEDGDFATRETAATA